MSRLLPFVLAFLSSFCLMILELVASRLVAEHLGSSLVVWTSVIGVILGGICLGNVLGGRLADRQPPERTIGTVFGLGSLLVLSCLWMSQTLEAIASLDGLSWSLRTLLGVTVVFLVPGTVLGMVGPVVAKMAVERAKRSGSALGDVYMLGSIGSIAGTFLAGFVLIYLARISVIVAFVAAFLALITALVWRGTLGKMVALCGAGALFVGGILTPLPTLADPEGRGSLPGVVMGSTPFNVVSLAGQVLVVALGLMSGIRLVRLVWGSGARGEGEGSARAVVTATSLDPAEHRQSLADLAFMSFAISLAFMSFEMVAGRLLSRHTGSSIYGWTSIIGVCLGGLSLGNYLGGKLADRVRTERAVSWLFLIASILVALVLVTESVPSGLMMSNPVGHFLRGEQAELLDYGRSSVLWYANAMDGVAWWLRILLLTAIVFFLPSVALGTVSPVVAKLGVDRFRSRGETGKTIGKVYAWGMLGSLLGTFLTGYYLIDWLGTKGMLLGIATMLAIVATMYGTLWHAFWAGVPLGLCVIGFVPLVLDAPVLEQRAVAWGLMEEPGDPETIEGDLAYTDESAYYYIKVDNRKRFDQTQLRTLVLDSLIHGYFVLDHPEQVEYEYEFIYGLVTDRFVRSRSGTADPTAPPGTPLSAFFLGGGAYMFPRHLQSVYPGTTSDVAEIDPAVTRANHIALGLPPARAKSEWKGDGHDGIRTLWGDARQVVTSRYQGAKKYDVVFGDAFSDFSVPWHLTTHRFNEMMSELMTDDGIYMINIIDINMSDEKAREIAELRRRHDAGEKLTEDELDLVTKDFPGVPADPEEAVAYARKRGGFLSSWLETAKLTFPHLYVFGTSDPGWGLRETFVVVAAKKALDLEELGIRETDPQFYDEPTEMVPYTPEQMEALRVRSRGIVLTDDYAPVENLLAPVAESRGD